ncbi:hypothetical protein NCTGTJJY_CDS0187 [Serratia phage 92A1]|nr:hypothetical protein NCTGTJJY_CDS0187 [Serratia phage 92A1]
MIISKSVKQKISASNYEYFKSLGYDLQPIGAPRWGYRAQIIDIDVLHLKPMSNVRVDCRCDLCGSEYEQRFSRNTDTCYACRKSETMSGNKYGSANKGKTVPLMQGPNHPRWNPNKSEYNAYASKVRSITRMNKDIWSKWPNADKLGLCGINNAYQLDHKVSVAYGFYNLVPAEIIGDIDNLEIITWEQNRLKGKSNSIDLWDLL